MSLEWSNGRECHVTIGIQHQLLNDVGKLELKFAGTAMITWQELFIGQRDSACVKSRE